MSGLSLRTASFTVRTSAGSSLRISALSGSGSQTFSPANAYYLCVNYVEMIWPYDDRERLIGGP